MAVLTVEDIAQEVFSICRERTNTTRECLDRIAKDIIGNPSAAKDEKLENIIRKYRETYKGLQAVAEYVRQKCYE